MRRWSRCADFAFLDYLIQERSLASAVALPASYQEIITDRILQEGQVFRWQERCVRARACGCAARRATGWCGCRAASRSSCACAWRTRVRCGARCSHNWPSTGAATRRSRASLAATSPVTAAADTAITGCPLVRTACNAFSWRLCSVYCDVCRSLEQLDREERRGQQPQRVGSLQCPVQAGKFRWRREICLDDISCDFATQPGRTDAELQRLLQNLQVTGFVSAYDAGCARWRRTALCKGHAAGEAAPGDAGQRGATGVGGAPAPAHPAPHRARAGRLQPLVRRLERPAARHAPGRPPGPPGPVAQARAFNSTLTPLTVPWTGRRCCRSCSKRTSCCAWRRPLPFATSNRHWSTEFGVVAASFESSTITLMLPKLNCLWFYFSPGNFTDEGESNFPPNPRHTWWGSLGFQPPPRMLIDAQAEKAALSDLPQESWLFDPHTQTHVWCTRPPSKVY